VVDGAVHEPASPGSSDGSLPITVLRKFTQDRNSRPIRNAVRWSVRLPRYGTRSG